MLSKDLHPPKALSPMRTTLSGIVMLSKDLHPPKALSPMLVTLSGIAYDFAFCILNAISLSLFLLNSTAFSHIKYGDLLIRFPFQPENGFPFISTTDAGIVILVKEEHPLNALSPMLVTLSGIVMLSNDEHNQKAQSPILVTLLGMFMFVNEKHHKKSPIADTRHAAGNVYARQ